MAEQMISDRLRRVAGKNNSLVKELRRSFHRGELTEDGSCAIEGLRIVEEAIRSGLKFRAVFFSESADAKANRVLPQIGSQVETLVLPDSLFAAVVPSETPQGVAALVHMPVISVEDVLERRPGTHISKSMRRGAPPTQTTEAHHTALVVVVVGLQDPGNLGTLIRSAEAFATSGVILAGPNVSPFNSKVVRASAGSIFRVPVVRAETGNVVSCLREHGFRLLATSSHKGTPLDQAQLTGPAAVFIGSEGGGIPRELLAGMDQVIVIPHSEHVESLNAGVAASIILYEAARQKK
jgi:TrmH family RNA methyltransferase